MGTWGFANVNHHLLWITAIIIVAHIIMCHMLYVYTLQFLEQNSLTKIILFLYVNTLTPQISILSSSVPLLCTLFLCIVSYYPIFYKATWGVVYTWTFGTLGVVIDGRTNIACVSGKFCSTWNTEIFMMQYTTGYHGSLGSHERNLKFSILELFIDFLW